MIENIQPTDERAFEKSIEQALVGSTRESREAAGLTDIDQQCPGPAQYYWGCPTDLDKRTALDVRRLWHFLNRSQPEVLAEYKGSTNCSTSLVMSNGGVYILAYLLPYSFLGGIWWI